ncbi:MAG: PfaD family polyunsaturated fatty acid/polyketide biosynthesis protein [Thermodesulfobacteriota bacterium]|nr:PfaD family polyunsaturated fatty acid/polyketide biosynthesis protein [Thermodesulfobacteriota bacterium]
MHGATRSDKPYGIWRANGKGTLKEGADAFKSALLKLKDPVFVVNKDDMPAVATGGTATLYDNVAAGDDALPLSGFAPPLPPDSFGSTAFKCMLGIRYPYVAGAMANGITSVEMVVAAARAGMVGFFGAAGLPPSKVAEAIDRLQTELKDLPFGMNLIHSSGDPNLENEIVNLYLEKGVRLISASAYMRLTPFIVLYRLKGIHSDADGNVVTPNRIVAKVSRVEVASRFFEPPPEKIVAKLLEQGLVTQEEASLASRIPMADALTAEADSGGHTDNRPALALLPTMLALRDEICAQHQYSRSVPVGLGGGIATPAATAAAFSMGAGYVITGSINQSCVEAGVCDTVRQMLVEAGQADVTMAPAADMFEMGGKVQVLKRGTMFAMRACKLYDCYVRYNDFAQLPQKERDNIEKNFLRRSFGEEWEETRKFFLARDPRQVERAEKDTRHKMALVFRSYLGRSSMWGVVGDPDRKVDYQIWCGPAIGAFNEWVKGSFLEKAENRNFTTVALNLLVGASVVTRASWLRNQGIQLPPDAASFVPMTADALTDIIAS